MSFKALIEPKLLKNSLSAIAEIIDEGNFRISKEGISFLAADRAMVAAVDLILSSEAFEEYEVEEERIIGLNIPNFLSIVKRAGSKDKIGLYLEDNKLIVEIRDSTKRRFQIPLLEISQEDVPQIEQLEFSVKLEMDPQVLSSGIEDAELIADSVVLKASPSGFQMFAEGDVSRTELELERDNPSLFDLSVGKEVKARYPIDYLIKMVKTAKVADSVVLEFGQDYPLKLSFKMGEKAKLSFVLAPRVMEET